MIRFAPAGWDYEDWYGTVYPKPKPKGFDPLSFLAGYVSAIEINSTFYRPAAPRICAGWRDRVRGYPGFRFTAKLSKRFTHERASAWTTTAEVAEVRAGMDVLQEAGLLGALLMQFPWSFRNDERNREWLADLIATFSTYPLVLEVRHESWNTAEVYQELSEKGVGIANIDQPLHRDSLRPAAHVTAPVAYVRVHGRNYKDWFRGAEHGQPGAETVDRRTALADRDAKFDYLYTIEELLPWVERIKAIAAQASEVYIVTNNRHAQALANLMQLIALITGQPARVPPTLLATYPAALQGYVRSDEPTIFDGGAP